MLLETAKQWLGVLVGLFWDPPKVLLCARSEGASAGVAGETKLDKHRWALNQLQRIDQGDLMICIELQFMKPTYIYLSSTADLSAV